MKTKYIVEVDTKSFTAGLEVVITKAILNHIIAGDVSVNKQEEK